MSQLQHAKLSSFRKIVASGVTTALFSAVLCAGTPTYKEKYSGGSLNELKPGDSIGLTIEGDKIQLSQGKGAVLTIPAAAVTEVNYGQDVHRRVGTAIGLAAVSFGAGAFMLLSKSKKHFIGLTWDDAGKKGGLAIQADKNDYRGLLTALEGVTGKKAVNSDTMNVKN
ncbi:MAG TPA: hypothetical protein VKX25_02610 [Bryobacteraceae bacterium]|jgi:hypothetical protein|nr:hypothetical protein [Bryobacteraceae bacterium]